MKKSFFPQSAILNPLYFLLGIISFSMYAVTTIVLATAVILLSLFAYIIPIPRWRKFSSKFLQEGLLTWWAKINTFIIRLTTRTEWDIQGSNHFHHKGWHLLICNHRSWLDILVLETVFYKKVPALKFFMKRELLWVLPVAGIACYMMGFPYVQRYNKSYIKKHPEKAGEDLEITKRACERFKNRPITIVNYIEGSRITPDVHQQQTSPYRHLLKPKAGGFAFIVAAMKEHLENIINVTIIYPDPKTNFWQFLQGKTKKIIVRYEVIPVTAEILGDYFNDRQFRIQFQRWLNQLWHQKDQLIDDILRQETNK
jgi:1-acyl-sn-glycerol-3-phosphate acyltransferase